MAPIVCLPIREMSRLPDLQARGGEKKWADMEDLGTPSPWTEYPNADLKQVWPSTPTPSDTVGGHGGHGQFWPPARRVPSAPMQTRQPTSGMEQHSLALDQPTQGPFPALAQTCPVLPEMPASNGAVGPVGLPIENSYAALSQTCPAHSDMPVPSAAGVIGMPLQQTFPGYEVDLTLHNVNESMVVHAPQPWGCEFNDWNSTSVEDSFATSVQWPNFALPQPDRAPEAPPPLLLGRGRWAKNNEDAAVPSKADTRTAAAVEPSVDSQSQKTSQHGSGQCRPCAWFWRQQGCRNGDACGYCHLCPEGELKSRKKNKIAAMKMGALTPVKAKSVATSGWGLKLDTLLKEKP